MLWLTLVRIIVMAFRGQFMFENDVIVIIWRWSNCDHPHYRAHFQGASRIHQPIRSSRAPVRAQWLSGRLLRSCPERSCSFFLVVAVLARVSSSTRWPPPWLATWLAPRPPPWLAFSPAQASIWRAPTTTVPLLQGATTGAGLSWSCDDGQARRRGCQQTAQVRMLF